jgi:serine/threonine protein kinase
MDDEMLDDDADLIEQVSDDDEDEGQAMDEEGAPAGGPAKQERSAHSGRGTRLSDQLANDDDEPALAGYERTEMIGQGAYGIVYKGKKEDTGETVAIKRIPFADSTPEGGVPCNVIREISLLREIDHPNVVRWCSLLRYSYTAGRLY